jgi:hypothetical protein
MSSKKKTRHGVHCTPKNIVTNKKIAKCTLAFSMVVKTPVDSTTYRAPASPHWMALGSFLWKKIYK